MCAHSLEMPCRKPRRKLMIGRVGNLDTVAIYLEIRVFHAQKQNKIEPSLLPDITKMLLLDATPEYADLFSLEAC